VDELFDLLKEFARLIPLNTADKTLEEAIRTGWHNRLDAIKAKMFTLRPYQGPVPGAAVDEDIPPAPAHWERPTEAPPEAPAAPVAPAPATVAAVTPAPPLDTAATEAALANLAPAPGVTGLPATTLAEQEAAAPPTS